MFNDKLADGKSQSASLCVFVQFLETLENIGLFVFRNAAACICYGEKQFLFRCFLSSSVMLPCGVNLVELISKFIRTCCRRESSVSISMLSSSVAKCISAWVCFTLLTVSVTFRQMVTMSCLAMLNCILPNSRLDKSITSLMSFNNNSEFCKMTSLHWRRVSSSRLSSVSSEEKPERAFRGYVSHGSYSRGICSWQT